ncbi:MAG TPA: ABC transporter substrate-binding protein [bacterium]|nr:ABC transporter substrate-binding protein [bacterium]
MDRSMHARDVIEAALQTPGSRRAFLRRAMLALGVAMPPVSGLLLGPGLPRAMAAAGKGGTVTVPATASPTSWDLTKSDWITWGAVNYLYDRLLDADEKENLRPMLATTWSVSKDGLTYTLKLRRDVKFHDGTPFNAAAVKFNFERHLTNKNSRYFPDFEAIDHVETPDDATVRVVLKTVNADMPYNFAGWGAIQLSPTTTQRLGSDYASHPVGTGPFKFQAYVPDSHIEFVRNDQYWQKPPVLDGLRVNILPDLNVEMDNLQAKTLDALYYINPKDVDGVKKMGAAVEARAVPGAQFISMNVTQEPTSELAVRKAIARAVDRDAMIKKLLYGYAVKARAGASPTSHYYNPDVLMVNYNPGEAAKILDEAGWKLGPDGIRQRDGKRLALNLLSTTFQDWSLYNQVIQEQLKAVGIDSKITSLEWGTYLDTWRENKNGWNITYHSQGSVFASTAVLECSWQPNAFWNICQIRKSTDPQIQRLSQQLQSIADQVLATPDPAKRRDLAKQAQTLYQENQLTVWLWHGESLTGLQPYVKDYDMQWHGRVVGFTRAWLNK